MSYGGGGGNSSKMKKHVRPLTPSSSSSFFFSPSRRRWHGGPSAFAGGNSNMGSNSNALSLGLVILMATLGYVCFLQFGHQRQQLLSYDRHYNTPPSTRFSTVPGTERWRALGDGLMTQFPGGGGGVSERLYDAGMAPAAAGDAKEEEEEEEAKDQVAPETKQEDEQAGEEGKQQAEEQQQHQEQQQQQPPPEQPQPEQPEQQQQQQQPEPPSTPATTTTPTTTKTRIVLTLDYHDMAGAITPTDDFETACEKSGKNVGNLVWLYSASHYIMDPDANVLMSPKTRKGSPVDAVVIPSANILWNMSDLDATKNKDAMMQSFATMRPTTTDRTPRFIIGIGVKGYEGLGESTSNLFGDLGEVYTRMYTPSDYVLHEQYVATLGAIAKDAKAIGVRGPFTEKLLRNYGVEEAMALGCPSLFLNPTPSLGATLQSKIAALGPHSRVAFNMPQRWLPRLMTFLLRMAMQSERHMIIWQSPTDMWFLQRAEKELGIKVPREKIKWFRDFESWSDTMCRFDAIVGSRIHGNMIGVACATPMLLIASDIRTHEMGAGMKIPMLQTDLAMFQVLGPKLDQAVAAAQAADKGNATGVLKDADLPTLAQLFQAANFDGAAFDKNRYLQASRYERILTDMKVVPSERIRALAALYVS